MHDVMECQWSANGICQLAQVTSAWLIAKKQHSIQLYMQNRNRAELHIADPLLERIIAAWRNWKRLVVALVLLAFKKRRWSSLGVHLRAIKNRSNPLEPEGP